MQKKLFLFFLLYLVSFLFYGCSALLEERSFVDEMDRDSDGFFVAGRDFPVTSGDSGEAFRSRSEILKRTPASKRRKAIEDEKLSIENELRDKLAQEDEEDLRKFHRDSEYMESDSEKLYYLSMGAQERTNYVNTKIQELSDEESLKKDSREFLKRRSVRSQEIAEGMSKDDVVSLWGKPTKIEVAGHPKFENERWSFAEGGQVKRIYFEAGKVQGWSLDF